jgi:PBP1b-binding outer membrane lipoprotein LpoB
VRALLLALLIAGCAAPVASSAPAAPAPAADAEAVTAELSMEVRELI